MRKFLTTTIIIAVVILSFMSIAAGVDVLPDRGLYELGHERVELRGGFWGPRLKTHHETTIPHALDCLERNGHITNFDKAAGVFDGSLRGHHAYDSDIHKAMEGAMTIWINETTDSPRKQAGKSPVQVFVLAGQSNMQGQGVVDMNDPKNYNSGKGNLEYVMANSPLASMYTHLKDAEGKWVVRDDVWIRHKTERRGLLTGGLTIGFTGYGGATHIGPELQIGHVLGDMLQNQVLLIKTAWGGKSLFADFRPPSSGVKVGLYYTRMLQEVQEALDNLKNDFPNYNGGGYEFAGFIWFQGWNDMFNQAARDEYETNLVNLIKDLRAEWKVPNLPVVIGELGNGGPKASANMLAIRKAQAAAAAHPEFNGAVTFVSTTDFARPAEESPNKGHGHHWFGNAESYFLIGNALGEGMKKLLMTSVK